jgi:hypothetical protein
MKQKILEGESLEECDSMPRPFTDIISIAGNHRVNKSVLGVRTTKNGQHLRKIAEGLGEFNGQFRFN